MNDSKKPQTEAEALKRREAFKRLGKFAIVTAPAVMAVLKPKQASAIIYGPPQ